MTIKHIEASVLELNPKEAPYIMADTSILSSFNSYLSWKNKDASVVALIDDGRNPNEVCEMIAEDLWRELEEKIQSYGDTHLTPANVKVGDGATINLYTDRHAGTIVNVTPLSVTVRRDKATLSPDFKPEYIPGGFSVICTNSDEQEWQYEPDEHGALTTVRWSRKFNRYGRPGDITLSKGRHEYYDYNF